MVTRLGAVLIRGFQCRGESDMMEISMLATGDTLHILSMNKTNYQIKQVQVVCMMQYHLPHVVQISWPMCVDIQNRYNDRSMSRYLNIQSYVVQISRPMMCRYLGPCCVDIQAHVVCTVLLCYVLKQKLIDFFWSGSWRAVLAGWKCFPNLTSNNNLEKD